MARVAVLGGGNGSYAAAADLAERGHDVRLWRRDAAAFAPVRELGRLTLADLRGRRTVTIGAATLDLGAAVQDAELIVVPLPAFAQNVLAAELAPHLRAGQVVFLPPGTFGSYVMAQRAPQGVAFAETGTLPWLARKHGPAEIAITTRATRLPTGVYPARLGAAAFSVLYAVFPAVLPVEDALSGALMNAGPIIHPPLILMNAGPLEASDRYDIHNEGTQPAVRRVTDALDAERIAVREALGYAAPHFPLADHYTSDRWMYGNLAHDRLVESGDWRERIDVLHHRYMTEDVVYGLAFLVSVADWAGVDVPVARGLLAIAGPILGRDLAAGPRTLRALELDGLGRAAMREMLLNGA